MQIKKLILIPLTLLWMALTFLYLIENQVYYKVITKKTEEVVVYSITPFPTKEINLEFITKSIKELPGKTQIQLNGEKIDSIVICKNYFNSNLHSCKLIAYAKLSTHLSKLQIHTPMTQIVGQPLISIKSFNRNFIERNFSYDNLLDMRNSPIVSVYKVTADPRKNFPVKITSHNSRNLNAIEVIEEQQGNVLCSQQSTYCSITLDDSSLSTIKKTKEFSEKELPLFLNLDYTHLYPSMTSIEQYYGALLEATYQFKLVLGLPLLLMMVYSVIIWKEKKKNELDSNSLNRFRIILGLFITCTALLTKFSLQEMSPNPPLKGSQLKNESHNKGPLSIHIPVHNSKLFQKENLDQELIKASTSNDSAESKIHGIKFSCVNKGSIEECWMVYRIFSQDYNESYRVLVCDKNCKASVATDIPKSGLTQYTGRSVYYQLVDTWIWIYGVVHLLTLPLLIIVLPNKNNK